MEPCPTIGWPSRGQASVSGPVVPRLGDELHFYQNQVFGESGSPITFVYLIHSGLVSIVVPSSDGDNVEVAMLGHGALLGGACAVGINSWVNTAVAQIGGLARAIKTQNFIDAMRDNPELRLFAFRSEEIVSTHAQQAAACNARHKLEQRLCSWLLRAQQISGAADLPFTQEFLARMLGVGRGGVSMIAANLHNKGVLQCRRGHIRIIDASLLKERACSCYDDLNHKLQNAISTKNYLLKI
jgi:CRP-like cAMP-binding protein